jgi:hypothetical protein
MVKGNSKNRGLMLARDRARCSVFPQTAGSGGEKQVARDQRPSVSLRGAALETPGNLWSVAPPGHYRRDGCRLRLTRPHVLEATCGAAAAVGLQDTQPRGCHLQVSLAAASASPEHTRSNTPTLGVSAGKARRETDPRAAAGAGWRGGGWTGAGAGWRSNWWRETSTCMGAGISWWMGVKGRVCGKQRLTRVAVCGQAATRLELLGLAPRQWRGPRMAAPGALAAALFAKQRARAEQDQRAAKKVEKQKADKSKRGKDVGNREKNKASGTARGRDDADSTLEQGKRSKGQSQAGAHQLPGNDASGGGSTSEDMNE